MQCSEDLDVRLRKDGYSAVCFAVASSATLTWFVGGLPILLSRFRMLSLFLLASLSLHVTDKKSSLRMVVQKHLSMFVSPSQISWCL